MSTPELRRRMAERIVDFEARRKNGKIIVYWLPEGDGGGKYEVAGINDKYHPEAAAKLKALVEAERQEQAEVLAAEYIADYTEAVARWTRVPAVEFYLRDTAFNRGTRGAALIVQAACGVPEDGLVGPVTCAAISQVERNAKELLCRLRTEREAYERKKRDETSPFWKGLVNRWDNALAFAETLPTTPNPSSRFAAPRSISSGSAKRLRLLCVHGVGEHEQNLDWVEQWRAWVESGLRIYDPSVQVEADLLFFQECFAKAKINPLTYAKALAGLVGSGIWHGLIPGQRSARGERGTSEKLRWTAGMVAQWADNPGLRADLRAIIHEKIADWEPDIVVAHSLGSLITYDAFVSKKYEDDIAGRVYLTFGSQIGSPFVRGTFGGRLVGLKAKHWYHLFNPNDDVLTAPLDIGGDDFTQVIATFEREGAGDHDAEGYLSTDKRRGNESVGPLAYYPMAVPPQRVVVRRASGAKVARTPQKRALIVGINEYADPRLNLDGCVNDAFLMSAVLQECQFQSEDIRLVLNARATAAAIRERLEWLFDGVKSGDQRVLIYSGHGAKIESYGIGEVVDREDECLVPHDFDWSLKRAILDDDIYDLYSQLPYDSEVLFFLDCCHAAGVTRDGQAKTRGVTPPDDIRHRSLRWDAAGGMWVSRALPELHPSVIDPSAAPEKQAAERLEFAGAQGVTLRLGRANGLRMTDHATFREAKNAFSHQGPYMPIIFQACQETEFAFEYRHGNQSFGAFSFSVAEALREAGRSGKKPSFKELCEAAGERIRRLGHDQTPTVAGPSAKLVVPVPWFIPPRPRRKPVAKARK